MVSPSDRGIKAPGGAVPLIHRTPVSCCLLPLPGLFNLPLFRKPEQELFPLSDAQRWKCILELRMDRPGSNTTPPPFFLNSFSPHKAAKHIPVLILLLEECKWL